MMLAEQLRLAGVPTFPCWARYDHARHRWSKGPAVPRETSWLDVAGWPFNDPRLDWSSGVVGVPIPRGVVILDLDLYKGVTREAVEQLLGCRLPWDAALVQTTIGGGHHYAFGVEWDVRQGDSLGVPGFDTRVAGKGFICSGNGYTPNGFGLFALAYPASLPRLPDACRTVLEAVKAAPREVAPAVEGDRDVDQLISALRHINPGGARADWLRVGLALRNFFKDDEAAGLDVFDRWSAGEWWPGGTPENYVAEHIPGQWASFKPDGDTTAATLFYKAMQGGWNPPARFIDTAAAFGASTVTAERFEELLERVIESGGDTRQTQAIVDEIRAAGCNALQVALLAAELKIALKEAGIKDTRVAQHIDGLLSSSSAAPPRMLPGKLPEAAGGILDPDTPLHPTAWAPLQTKGKDMKPKGTTRNFEIMLQAYGVRVTFDEIGKRIDITGPSVPGGGVLHEEAALAYLDSLSNLNDYPVAAAKGAIMPMANQNTVNPVREWVASAPWDGQDHVGALFREMQLSESEDPRFCEVLFRKWMRGAYSIGTGTIRRWEHVIVLMDPFGGAGKTRFFSTLCPPELRTDSVILDADNKDSIKMAVSYWLTELGELDGTFDRSASHKLKAFLSLEKDEMRLAYGRTYLKYPRRTAFFASVNEVNFLRDPSNNRRFWAMEVVRANHLHTVNVQQAWAQAAAECAAGYEVFLNPQEMQLLVARNEGFRGGSRIADRLARAGLVEGTSADHKTLTEVLELAGVGNPTKADLDECGRWLRRVGIHQVKVRGVRGYNVVIAPATAAAFMSPVGSA